MRKRVEEFIREKGMILPGGRVIAAVSGGADSVCLLHLLARLRKDWGLKLRAVHVNHQLRGDEAKRDEEFVQRCCKELSVELVCREVEVREFVREKGVSEEEAGRILRYQVLEEEAEKWEQEERKEEEPKKGKGENREERKGEKRGEEEVKIAVGHHRDDQAETVLFHLFRGSGLKGLGGIRATRGRIIRPLLVVGREEILTYLKEEGLEFCEDSTNFSGEYTRNRIRHKVLPLIEKEINGRASEHIWQAAERIWQADIYLEGQAEKWLNQYGQFEEKTGRFGADVQALMGEEEIIQTYVIRRMIAVLSGSRKDLTRIHVEAVRGLLEKQAGKRADLPYGLAGRREQGVLWVERGKKIEEEVQKEDEFYLPEIETLVFSFEKGMKIPQNQYTKWFDYDKIKGALSVRTRQTGDYFLLPDGGRKTIKAYMVDEKIPAGIRERIPLLADGSHILWIIGKRISEGGKVTDRTKRILQVHVSGGKEDGG